MDAFDMAIADKMLRALEEEYLAIQSCNIAPSALMLDNVKPESSAADNQYQALAEDDLADAGMSDDETHSEEEISGVGSAPCKSREVQGIQSSQQPSNEENLQTLADLVEIFPTPDSTYAIPEREVNINSSKIKEMTLKMNLSMPSWINDEAFLRKRVTELFGSARIQQNCQ